MGATTDDAGHDLARGRAAYSEGRWADAFDALVRADAAAPLSPEDLERACWAAGLVGKEAAMLEMLERLFHARTSAGQLREAARAAFWLGLRLMILGEVGRGSGWFGRAQRAVSGVGGECAERGYLLLPVSNRHLMTGDDDAAHDAAAEAAAIGDRCGDADLSAFARHLQGRALIRRGELAAGLALIDEAMVGAASGELSPMMTGLVYCSVIATCHQVYAIDRAREWTAALSEWCKTQAQLVTFTGTCLVHRAEIMQIGGQWQEAEEQARLASERFDGRLATESTGEAYYQQGEIHRLRGELAEAEAAYERASQRGCEPQPGLALLRLLQGEQDSASAALRRVLATTSAPHARARFLPAQVEVALASGEIDEARAAAQELASIAARLGTEVLDAMACHARGAVLLAEGQAEAAVEPLRRAFSVWQAAGAPYIAARIRMLSALACRALGDRDGCRLEMDAARRVFEELGAKPDLALLERRAAEAPETKKQESRPHGLTERELEVLRLVARGMTNKSIARDLGVSERTVDRHVSNIFGKLDLSSRSAATAFAYENGLV